MQPNHPTLSALRTLHADLAGQLQVNEEAADKLRENMKHVEAVIKLIAPSYNLATVAVRRRKPNPYFKRGTIFRSVLELLRETQEPLTASEITSRLLASKGVPEPSREDFRNLFGGVQSSLRNNDGKTVQAVGEGRPVKWALMG
ncbi:hypothetical protein [Methylocystis sp. S23]|jgi:hypothetical protein